VGYVFFEPLVNGIKGLLILGVTVMALISAVKALFTGGREIVLGLAVIYGLVATIICWTVALLIQRAARRSQSPLVDADAASWLVNAAISSAVMVTLLIVFLIRNSSLRFLVPYVDPFLVILVSTISIGVPVRLARKSLLELLNRTPSAELLARIRDKIQELLAELPVKQLTVRVLQPGRTRLISAHVLLAADYDGDLKQLDAVRERIDTALRTDHPQSFVDVIFTADPRWSAPLRAE
jgi:predicted Co/Zn/Cd cation transporter (cation efflux family)